jgi:LacI family transcriptional regulator
VAERAGVGVGTVSRVLNDAPDVAPGTRERVRAVMEELGYRPSTTARNLSLGRTQTVGVMAPFFTQPSVVERLRGIDEILGASTYQLAIFNIESTDQRREVLRRFARRDRVDGVLVISLPPTDAELRALRRDALPVVLVDAPHPDLPSIVVDDMAGGAMAARHLLEAGHRRIGFVGDIAHSPLGFTSSELRLRGMREELARAGVDLPATYVRHGPHGREAAAAMTADILVLRRPPTAIFAASDVQAFGVIDAASRAGLSVPHGLSVIGFDDIEMAAAMNLTTVRQPLRETGRLGAAMLLAALEGEEGEPQRHVASLEIVRRRTVGRTGA